MTRRMSPNPIAQGKGRDFGTDFRSRIARNRERHHGQGRGQATGRTGDKAWGFV